LFGVIACAIAPLSLIGRAIARAKARLPFGVVVLLGLALHVVVCVVKKPDKPVDLVSGFLAESPYRLERFVGGNGRLSVTNPGASCGRWSACLQTRLWVACFARYQPWAGVKSLLWVRAGAEATTSLGLLFCYTKTPRCVASLPWESSPFFEFLFLVIHPFLKVLPRDWVAI
jgi:hypothetical protein